MTLNIQGLNVTISTNNIQHNNALILCRVSRFIYCYPECLHAKCLYDECRYAQCRYTECRGAVYFENAYTYHLPLTQINFVCDVSSQGTLTEGEEGSVQLTSSF